MIFSNEAMDPYTDKKIGRSAWDYQAKEPLKSYEIRHSDSFDEGDNLGFLPCSNQILAGIFKRICLDSLYPNRVL